MNIPEVPGATRPLCVAPATRAVVFLVAALLLVPASSIVAQVPGTSFRAERDAMGTQVEIVLYAHDRAKAESLFELVFEEIERVEQLLSDYRPTSEISRINAGAAAAPLTTDTEMFRILNRALGWSDQSGGAFDPTVGALVDAWGFRRGNPAVPARDSLANAMKATGRRYVRLDLGQRTVSFSRPGVRLDPGAFGKGYAAQQAADLLRANGVTAALVGFGQSTYVAVGQPPGSAGWLVHLDGGTMNALTSIRLADRALSTSGQAGKDFLADGVRYTHILDPRTGRPAVGTRQVTVITSDGMDADILSTAAYVLGPDALASLIGPVPGASAWLLEDSPGEPEIRTIRWTSTERVGYLP